MVIGVTSHLDSGHRDLSDILIDMGEIKEACPLGLTPSTSVAVMSTICDAIALTLMELKGVTREDYGLRLIKDIVTSHATDFSTDRLILEGSAILPELFVTLTLNNISAIWLTASNELFEQRIYNTSQYETKSPREKKMIEDLGGNNEYKT